MSKDFYKAFEDRYRGSRELIKNRLKVYVPFLENLKDINKEQLKALDIGCGRCEWLELLYENNIKATGIDLDESMINDSKNSKLDVKLGDGIKYLSKLEDSSLDIVSAFHVVEHISFEELQILVKEAYRVLKPAGLLILETPNPENIRVSSESFYLDPTHIKPIPSQFLQFFIEYYGFDRAKILRLQEKKRLLTSSKITLDDVLNEVSPDYSIIGQKGCTQEEFIKFDYLFEKEFGITLGELTSKYENRIQDIEKNIKILTEQLDIVFNSRSWKITAPLRSLTSKLKIIKSKSSDIKRYIKDNIKKFIRTIIKYISKVPLLKKYISKTLKYFPKIEFCIQKINNQEKFEISNIYQKTEFLGLSPRAKTIYHKLKSSIENNKEVR